MLTTPTYAQDAQAGDMEHRLRGRLAFIELTARNFLSQICAMGDFEAVAWDRRNRAELLAIAKDLAMLEGYVALSDITVAPYSRFVQAMAGFLHDEVGTALPLLLLGAQDPASPELRRLSRYWAATLLSDIGRYEQAIRLLQLAADDLPSGQLERYELERTVITARFFKLADEASAARPRERFEAAVVLLDGLSRIARAVYEYDAHDMSTPESHAVASARADIFTWIAHDGANLVQPLPLDAIDAATDACQEIAQLLGPEGSLEEIRSVGSWEALDESGFRAWALMQAQSAYASQSDRYLSLAFGAAECAFGLRLDGLADAYRLVERMVADRMAEPPNARNSVTTAQIGLICAARLVVLRDGSPEEQHAQLVGAHRRVREALVEMADPEVTVFSEVQRRNVTQLELTDETVAMFGQAALAEPAV